LSEEIIEKSSFDVLMESLTENTYALVFLIVFISSVLLLLYGKIDQSIFLATVFGGALVSILFKYIREEKK